MLNDDTLRAYQDDLCIVTGAARDRTGIRDGHPALAVLVRPDGYVAARGTAQCMTRITSYLRQVAGAPGSQRLSQHAL